MRAPIQAGRPMQPWRLLWSSGSRSGWLVIWAPDGDTAVATVRAHASWFGIPYESPIVGRAVQVWGRARPCVGSPA
jgi:hypothetical protein